MAVLFPQPQPNYILQPGKTAELLQGFLNLQNSEGAKNGVLTKANLDSYAQKRFIMADPSSSVAGYLNTNFAAIAKNDGNPYSISVDDLVVLRPGLPNPNTTPPPATDNGYPGYGYPQPPYNPATGSASSVQPPVYQPPYAPPTTGSASSIQPPVYQQPYAPPPPIGSASSIQPGLYPPPPPPYGAPPPPPTGSAQNLQGGMFDVMSNMMQLMMQLMETMMKRIGGGNQYRPV